MFGVEHVYSLPGEGEPGSVDNLRSATVGPGSGDNAVSDDLRPDPFVERLPEFVFLPGFPKDAVVLPQVEMDMIDGSERQVQITFLARPCANPAS